MEKKRFDKNKDKRPARRPEPREQIPVDESVISGRNAVKELLSSGRDIEKIYVQQGEREGSVKLLVGLASERRIQIVEASKQKLDQLASGGVHQGVAAIAAMKEYVTLKQIIEYAAETLSGIPSIIYGLVGMLLFSNNFGTSLLAGALTLVDRKSVV